MQKQMQDVALRLRCPSCGVHMGLRGRDPADGCVKRCVFCDTMFHFESEVGTDLRQAVDNLFPRPHGGGVEAKKLKRRPLLAEG